MPHGQTVLLDLARIAAGDQRYQLAPGPATPSASPELSASIRRFGLLRPLIGHELEPGGKVVLVDGRHRLAALLELGARQAPCLLLTADTGEADVLETALEAILAHRPVSPCEQALFCKKILQHLGRQQAAAFLPRFGLPPHPRSLDRLLELLALEENLLCGLHDGRLDGQAARQLISLAAADRLLLWGIIDRLRLSSGKQRKLVNSCRELALRRRTTVELLLATPAAQQILGGPGDNIPQLAGRLMDWLGAELRPQLTAAEQEFETFRKTLGLPRQAQLCHAPSFESDELTLSLRFADRKQLQAAWQLLGPVLDKTTRR